MTGSRADRRLCMVVHGPFPPDPRVARAVAVAVGEGWEVDVLATSQSGQERVERVDGARVIRLPVTHRWGAGAGAVLVEYLGFTVVAGAKLARLSAGRPYEVVHVHAPPDFLLVAALLPKIRGARVILDIHDLSPDMFAMRFGDRTGSRFADRALRLVERLATKVADEVVTVHEPYRRELTARGVASDKVTVVMNTVDERLLPQAGKRSSEDAFRVVYQGTITPPYGVYLLVEAAARIARRAPELRVEIYGDGDSLAEIRTLAARLGVDEHVCFSGGFLPHEEVLERGRLASVGVIPNLPTPLNRFALSTKLFEYVALGIPVVSADLPTIREHFADSEVRYFRAGDADALGAALLDVRRDPETAGQRAAAARQRYEQYRWPLNASRYAALLNRLAATSARS